MICSVLPGFFTLIETVTRALFCQSFGTKEDFCNFLVNRVCMYVRCTYWLYVSCIYVLLRSLRIIPGVFCWKLFLYACWLLLPWQLIWINFFPWMLFRSWSTFNFTISTWIWYQMKEKKKQLSKNILVLIINRNKRYRAGKASWL